MKLLRSLQLAVFATALGAIPARCAELVVGAPVELAECVEALSSAFLAEEKGARLRFVTGTSGDLYVKVSAGEAIDVYMSSDLRLQGQLLADWKMVYDTWATYATGRLVLWSLDKRFDVSKGMRVLDDPAVKKVAVGDGSDPYYGATLAAIGHVGLWEKVKPRLLSADSMQGMVNSVTANRAQVAILSYETVLASPMKGVGAYYLIPEHEYKEQPVDHAAVVTIQGKSNPLARRFVSFLKSAKAQAILIPKGFMKPPSERVEVR
nr:molybdate ABC transporter substrate-binding protein [uncultured Duganella sp.]